MTDFSWLNTFPNLPKMARDTLLATRQYLNSSLSDNTGLNLLSPIKTNNRGHRGTHD
ncbi:hypothetical protein [uncultured Shewanella sp.]|uniref:hypothetical protein n=1 Tax=uncultured Shewanella sp. TaxID=173975 RepID=UPI00262B3087|nr:hypothetical protein [uncultured Shewanella sp.]